ncbi:MAG TPA: hypothetical protein VG960_10575 [Caulobacteraceae bacterium]|nr:hypothetical protein [Caulobacteraceae bacterium]
MNPDQDPIARIRRELTRIQGAASANLLTPERLKAFLATAREACDQADEQLRDDEHFEITLDGLSALHRGGKPVRWAGHLSVIEGDRA